MKQQQQQQKQQKDQKLKWRGMKRKKYIKKQNWQVIDLNEVGWSGSNASWLESLRSKRSKLAWGKGNSPSSTPAPPPPFSPAPTHTKATNANTIELYRQWRTVQLWWSATVELFILPYWLLNWPFRMLQVVQKRNAVRRLNNNFARLLLSNKCQAMLNGGSLAHWLDTNDKGFCENWLL